MKGHYRYTALNDLKNAEDPSEVGSGVILTEKTPMTPKWYGMLFNKSMSFVREFGSPDLFPTMTCNPQWPEIVELSENNFEGTSKYRPDIICRVFREKVLILFDELIKNMGIFGKSIAYRWKLEFQKRGLPHVHGLVWLAKEDKISII